MKMPTLSLKNNTAGSEAQLPMPKLSVKGNEFAATPKPFPVSQSGAIHSQKSERVSGAESEVVPLSRAIELSNARIRYNRAKSAVEADRHSANDIYSNDFAAREAEQVRREANEQKLRDAETQMKRLGLESEVDPSLGERIKKIVTGGVKDSASKTLETAALANQAAGPGNDKRRQAEAETGEAFGNGFLGTFARQLIGNPSSGNAGADTMRKNLQAMDDDTAPQIYDAAERLGDSAAADIERAQQGTNGIERALVNAGVAGVQMTGDVVLGGGNGIIPMMVRSFGGGAQEARKKGYSVGQQLSLGLANAATEYFSEKLFGGNPAYDADVGLVNRAISAALNKIDPKTAGRVMSVLSSTAAETMNEGWEEVVSDLLDPMWEYVIAGAEDNRTKQEKLQQYVEDWVVGVLLGVMGQAGSAVSDTLRGNDTAKAAAEAAPVSVTQDIEQQADSLPHENSEATAARIFPESAQQTSVSVTNQNTVSAKALKPKTGGNGSYTMENAAPVSEAAERAVRDLGIGPSMPVERTADSLPAYGTENAARQAEFRRAQQIAERFGAAMEVAEVEHGADGKYANGVITISPNAKNPVMSVMVHELTHHMESSGRYAQFSKSILDHIARESDVGVDALKEAFKARYASRGIALDDAAAERELVAQYAQEHLLRDEEAVNRLARKNRSLVQTIRDWLSDLAVKLRGTSEERFIRNAERMYARALRNVGKTAGDEATRYMISSTTEGKPVAVVESDILSSLDTTSWDEQKKEKAKRAAKAALLEMRDGVPVNGINYKINRTSRREYTRSNDTERLYRTNKDAFADKMRAASVAGDVIIATTDWARDGGLTHPRKDNFADFVHGDVLLQSGESKYTAKTVVGITANGEYVLYDVTDLVPTSFQTNEELPTTAARQKPISDIQGSSSDSYDTTNAAEVNNQNLDEPRHLAAPDDAETGAEEARYLPTEEDIENGRQYSLGGLNLNDMLDAARPLPTAEEYAAEYEDWREQSLADAANERYMKQTERQGKKRNEPKTREKSRATQSRKELRSELLNGHHLSLEEWRDLARLVDRISRDMQAEGRVSDEKRMELIRTLAERTGASMADVEAIEQRFDDAMRRFADKAQLEIELRNRFGERLEREKDAWREVLRKKDEAQKQREAAAQTLRNLKRLRKRIGQNDTRLAEAMNRLSSEEQQIVREALGNISTDAQRLTEKAKAKMAENQEYYERMLETDPNYIPDKKTLALLERMDQTYLADMTAEELMSAHRALQTLEQHLSDMNKEIGKQRDEELGALYRASSEEIKKSKGRENTGRVRKFLDEDQLTAMNYLEMLGGWDENSTWNQTVAKQLEEGEQAKKAFIVEANRMVKDFREKNAKWITKSDGQGKGAIWYDIEVPALQEYGEGHKPIFGDTVTVHLTPAIRVELARGIRNDDNLRHAEGGVTFPNKELYSKGQRKEAYDRGMTVKLAPETMKSLFAYENLTSEEKALFDVMDTFFDGKAKAAINETSQIMDGVDRALTNHYSKIYTNKNYRATDATIVNESIGAMPSLQKRVFSRNPMLAMSVWEAFDDTVDTVSKYHGLAIPVRNVNMLLNWTENGQSMKDTLAQKWGGGAVSYVENLMRDLQNPKVKEKTGIDELTGKALNNYVTATFGMNPGIVLKQFSSFPSAAAVLGWSNFPKPSKIFGKGVDTELIAKYTPELEYRSMGYATPELAELKNNPNWTQQNKVTRFLFGGAIQGMDRFTVKAMWPWAENYVKRNYESLKPGTDVFYKKTAEVYNEAVGLTQPMYDVMHRAKIMRSGSDLTRAFTMFKTVPLQQQNMLRKAWGEARNATGKAKTDANINLARTVGAIVAANLMFEGIEFLNQAWKNAAKNYRDDDDELTLASAGEKIVMDALGDMAGMFVGGDEVLDILDLFRGKKNLYYAGMETPGISQLNAVVESLAKAVNAYRKVAEDVVDIRKNNGSVAHYVHTNGAELLGQFKDLAEDMAVYFGGIPATNIEKYLLGTLRVISPKLEQEYKTLFENTTKRDLSGLTGEALDVRVSDLIDERIEGVSDEAKGELARLYEETGTEVIPTDVPDHFTIDGETLTLSTAQEQKYRSAYTEAIGGALDKLVTGEIYRDLPDELRAKAITGLYNYAKDAAKSAVTGAEKESSTQEAVTAAEMGLAPEKYFAVKAGLAELDDLEGDEKTEARVEALRTAKLTPKERSAAYYAFIASDKEKTLLDNSKDAGKMADALMALRIDNMQDGGEKTKARCETLLDADLSEAEKRDAWLDTAGSMSAESRVGKVELFDELKETGVDFDAWLTFTRDTAGLKSDKDENGKDVKGQKKQDKVWAVINAMKLSVSQKNALHFAAGYAESSLMNAPWNRVNQYEEPLYLAAP